MIPHDVIDTILNNSDIVEVVSNYIKVIKKGNTYVAICPFHADTNPSLHISSSKQIFKCFVCGKGGNAISFISEYEHIDYISAVKRLAKMISFDDKSLHEEVKVDKNQKFYAALNDAKDFYHYILKTSVGRKAQEYLKKRNIDEQMQDYFFLGYAPSDSSLIVKTLNSKGHDIFTLDKVGITQREKGNIIDHFNSRLVFPIINENNNVIGFSARIIEGDDAKYINTSSTIVFNKSNALYNYNNAFHEARIANYCYVVEGFMDVFSLYRINKRSAVALMGTAFSKSHAEMLKKLNVEIRIMLDGDKPGQNACVKIIPFLEAASIPYKVVDYDGVILDPDEIYNTISKEELIRISDNLISGISFLIKHYLKEYDVNTLEGKKEFLKSLVNHLKYLKTRLEKEDYIKLLANAINVSYQTCLDYLKELIKNNPSNFFKNNTSEDNKNLTKKTTLPNELTYKSIKRNQITNVEKALLSTMLHHKEAIDLFLKSPNSRFDDDLIGYLYNYVLDDYQLHQMVKIENLTSKIKDSKNKDDLLKLLDELYYDTDAISYDQEMILEFIETLQKALLKKEQKANILRDIQVYGQEGAAKKIDERRGKKQ